MHKLIYHRDSGHGWLEVPIWLLGEAAEDGLKPSRYSYFDNAKAYLEEDCDAVLFEQWADAKGLRYRIKEKFDGNQSFIRGLSQFTGSIGR